MKRKIYIAGPMTDYPFHNFPAFDEARDTLRGKGWEVISPADMDREAGFDGMDRGTPDKEFLKDAIDRDIAALKTCSAMALLPGWEASTGALAEYHLAKWLGIPVFQYPSMRVVVIATRTYLEPKSETTSKPTIDKSGMKDSGERREFSTGSVRDMATGKGSPSLLPVLAITQVSKHFEKGCLKYGKRNWEKGQPYSAFFDSGYRHLTKFWGGAIDEDHLTAYAWNALCLLETCLRVKRGILPEELDDRPEALFNENGE